MISAKGAAAVDMMLPGNIAMPGMLIGPEEARMILPLPEPTESGGGRQRIFDNGLVMAIARGGRQTGRDVWKGSHVMQRYLSANRAELVAGKRAVELGAGAGYLSMSTHLLGSSLCVHTDKFLELSASNVHTNDCLLQAATGTFVRCACDWDEVQRTGALPPALAISGGFDLILAADCLYYDEKYAHSLVAVLALLLPHCEPGVRASVALLCQSYRGAPDVEKVFFEAVAREGLGCALVSQEELSPDRVALKRLNCAIWRLWREAPPAPAMSLHPAAPPQHQPLLDLRRVQHVEDDSIRTQWVFRPYSPQEVEPAR